MNYQWLDKILDTHLVYRERDKVFVGILGDTDVTKELNTTKQAIIKEIEREKKEVETERKER